MKFSTNTTPDIELKLLHSMYGMQKFTMLMMLLAGVYNYLVASFIFPQMMLFWYWSVAVCIPAVVGLATYYVFQKYPATLATMWRWKLVIFVHCMVCGIGLGMVPSLMLSASEDFIVIPIGCTLTIVGAFTLVLLSYLRYAIWIFLITLLAPFVIKTALLEGDKAHYLSSIVGLALVAFILAGHVYHGFFRRFLETQMRLEQSAQEAQQALALAERSQNKAEQASAFKSQFLANISHEIRTPLNAILGLLKLMQHTDLTNRQLDYTVKTEQSAQALLGLLNDVLDFSKIEANKMDLEIAPFRLDKMMQEFSAILAPNSATKSLEILFDIDHNIPKVLNGDAMRLRQVLLNIASNAIKFTERGEVVLSIKLKRLTEDGVELLFSVRDTGIGIAPEYQEIIFSDLTQAEGSTTRRFGGTGLGLSISKRLVAMMGGELRLQSTPHVGSTFYFELRFQTLTPSSSNSSYTSTAIASPAPSLTSAVKQAKGLSMENLSVLLVDDSATALQISQQNCQSWGWSVVATSNAQEAVAAVRQRMQEGLAPFDVLIIDWELQGVDGWQTLQQLYDLGQCKPAVTTIMVTGHRREHLLLRSQEEQAMLQGFVVKPYTGGLLFQAITKARTQIADDASAVETKAHVQRLGHLRILLVEDNILNQQVARELLAKEGAVVEVVENGELAVAALANANHAFDAVLMDIQMPVMDGLAATRVIRNELGMYDLPIIAMTANAMQSEREASLNAGMNAHVGKPFNIDQLVNILLKNMRLAKFD